MAWRAELIEIAARLEALIDFNDEDLPPVIEQNLRKATKALITKLVLKTSLMAGPVSLFAMG